MRLFPVSRLLILSCQGRSDGSINASDSCLITNTVFLEGIPTLGLYGAAILAVLLLGVGLVGFRRFA
jgi:hypothetical protein